MKFKKYIATIQHDNGTVKIIVTAQNITTARKMIKEAEGCPDSAILIILPYKKG